MKHEFRINGEKKLVLTGANNEEDILLQMIFPVDGDYNISIQGNSVTIKQKKDDKEATS